MALKSRVVLALITAATCATLSSSSGSFPPLANLARQSSLDIVSSSTSPLTVTCGQPAPSNYCRSGVAPASLAACVRDLCNQTCPYGTLYGPAGGGKYISLLLAPKYGSCSMSVSSEGVSQVDFNDGCRVAPPLSPDVSLGSGASFTLTGWLTLRPRSNGTILIKRSTLDNHTLFEVVANERGLLMNYAYRNGRGTVYFPAPLLSNARHFIAIQVYNVTASLFVNDISGDSSPFVSVLMDGGIADETGWVTVGQDGFGKQQFIGSMKDARFYSSALSNREIAAVYSTQLTDTAVPSPECLCPGGYPRINPLSPRYCISNSPVGVVSTSIPRLNTRAHPGWYVIDGDLSTAWISANEISDVDLTLYLGDTFQVFYVIAQFYGPLPAAVEIQRQPFTDSGFLPWQYYALNCSSTFRMDPNGPLSSPVDVNCLQLGTNGLALPPSSGNITFTALSSKPVARPGFNNFYGTAALQDFVRAASIRLRLRGHSLWNAESPQLQSYYGVYEVLVTGRCDCHGHAEVCDTTSLPYTCRCRPDSYTQGQHCDACLPLYNDKPFRDGDQFNAFPCKPCQCYNHSLNCSYARELDAYPTEYERDGGGRCEQCDHNTTGRHCELCLPLHYRSTWEAYERAANGISSINGSSQYNVTETAAGDPHDACLPCDCDPRGTVGGAGAQCDVTGGGQCPCKSRVHGRRCDACFDAGFRLDGSDPGGCISESNSSETLPLVALTTTVSPFFNQPWFIGTIIAGSLVIAAIIIVATAVTCARQAKNRSSLDRRDGGQAELSSPESIAYFDPRTELAGVSTVTYGSWSSRTPSRVSLREAQLAQSYINAAFSHLPAAQQYAATAGRPPPTGSTRGSSRASSHPGSQPSRRRIIDQSDDDSSSDRSPRAANDRRRWRTGSPTWRDDRRSISSDEAPRDRQARAPAGEVDFARSSTWGSRGPDSGVYDSDNDEANAGGDTSSSTATAEMVDTRI